METRKALRHHYVKLRSQLSPETCTLHGHAVAQAILSSPIFQQSRHISFYIAINNELPLEFLLNTSLQLQKECYLPRLADHKQRMEFRKFSGNDTLEKNKFGILEPLPSAPLIAPEALDMVLVPLVAWDLQGHRLGMGAGFYDRTFAFKTTQPAKKHKPWLIGIAHQCQQHPMLTHMPWDVCLDGLVTEEGFRICTIGC